MKTCNRWTLAFVFCSLAPLGAFAQAAEEPLMWLAWAQVAPGGEDSYVDIVKEAYGPSFDRLMDSGDVVGWGIAGQLNHSGGPGHVTWVTVRDWAGMDRLFNAIEADFEVRGSGEIQRLFQAMGNVAEWSAHRDWVVRHTVFNWPGLGDKPPKYIITGTHLALPGHDAMGLYEEYVQPIYDDLTQRGLIHGYGVYEPELHGGEGFTHVGWVFLRDLGKMDAMDKAFQKLEADGTFGEKFGAAFDHSAHRDTMWEILHLGGS